MVVLKVGVHFSSPSALLAFHKNKMGDPGGKSCAWDFSELLCRKQPSELDAGGRGLLYAPRSSGHEVWSFHVLKQPS